MFTRRGEEVAVVAHEHLRPVLPPLGASRIDVTVQTCPPQTVKVKRVGVVVIIGLVDTILEPSSATVHAFETIEERIYDYAVSRTTVTFGDEEFQNMDSHEVMVVVYDSITPSGAEPVSDPIFVLLTERFP